MNISDKKGGKHEPIAMSTFCLQNGVKGFYCDLKYFALILVFLKRMLLLRFLASTNLFHFALIFIILFLNVAQLSVYLPRERLVLYSSSMNFIWSEASLSLRGSKK